MADVIYDRFFSGVYVGDYNLTGTNLMVALVSGAYVPDQGAHDDYSNISAEVEGGLGVYKPGGQLLTAPTITMVGAAPTITGVFDAADVTWASSTITQASGAVIYQSGGPTAAEQLLIAYIDFAAEKSSSNGDFTISWNADGILRLRQQ